MAASNPQQMHSIQITNSMVCPTCFPLLVVEEYDHWKVSMERYLLGKEKGESMWKSVKEGQHVAVRTIVGDAVAALLGQDEQQQAPSFANDLEKCMMIKLPSQRWCFGVPPSLFEHIKLCKSAKEIWDTLQDLFEESENMKDKRLTSVVN